MHTRVVLIKRWGGKSSIAVNLAAISAHQGLKTLLIDLDPQANSSQYLLGDDATYSSESRRWSRILKTILKMCWGTSRAKA